MTALDVFNYMVLDSHGDEKPLESQVLPSFTSYGSYTLVYYTDGGDSLCAECATTEIRSWQNDESDDPPVAYDTYDEGPLIYCDGCNKPMESSYGDPAENG